MSGSVICSRGKERSDRESEERSGNNCEIGEGGEASRAGLKRLWFYLRIFRDQALDE